LAVQQDVLPRHSSRFVRSSMEWNSLLADNGKDFRLQTSPLAL
jgi:hypothetical protein